jgi:hypothetical protein
MSNDSSNDFSGLESLVVWHHLDQSANGVILSIQSSKNLIDDEFVGHLFAS